jgi:hypothetical protein
MDIFTTGVLRRVVRELPQPSHFFLNSFFREEQLETTEEIHFDVANGRRRIAPFVSPVVAGKVVTGNGFRTDTFKPAYVKDKRVFKPQGALKRAIGERIGGEISPAQRMQLKLASEMIDQIEMLGRRLELMAVEALRRGKATITGEEYPTVELDFGRHGDLTKALTTTARWGESGVEPLDDVEKWAQEVALHSGAAANQLVFDVKAWQLFSASPKVAKLLDRFRGADQLVSTIGGAGAKYMGNIGTYDCWVYSDWYEDPGTKALTPYLPDYTVVMVSVDLEGVRCFGAIQDEEAGIEPMSYFPKSWLEKDPAVRYLLMQSAPLMVPFRPNASLCATVR